MILTDKEYGVMGSTKGLGFIMNSTSAGIIELNIGI